MIFIIGSFFTFFSMGCNQQEKPNPDGKVQGQDTACLVGRRALDAESRYNSFLQNKFSHPIQLKLAKGYIHEFQDSSSAKDVRNAMGDDFCPSFAFDERTLGAFASLYSKGQIDGFRLYLAKYNKDKSDMECRDQTHYTLILVGTKRYDSASTAWYRDTLIPTSKGADTYTDLDDYSNPCRPSPCPDAVLLSLNPKKS